MTKKNKKPSKNLNPTFKKIPRTDPKNIPNYDSCPSWQLTFLDIDGEWGWNKIDKEFFLTLFSLK
ncbi:MAG: hypothetical protein V1872_04375 [bacterium]